MPDGKAAREARLAAALRENLKRRKAAVRPGEQHAAEAGQAGAAAHDERVPRDGTADQEFADRDTADQETADQETADRETARRPTGSRD